MTPFTQVLNKLPCNVSEEVSVPPGSGSRDVPREVHLETGNLDEETVSPI